MSQEKRIFSCSCDIKTIALFNIFVKTSPNFREIAAFAWHFFVNDAQLTFLEDTGGVENGKFETLENKREHKKPPRQTPGRLEKPSPSGKGDRCASGGGRGALDVRAVRNYRLLSRKTPLLSLADASRIYFLWYSCHRQLY